MKEVVILLAILLFYQPIYGESDDQPLIPYPAEEIQVHLTQTILFPGEVLGFKIYCTNPLFSELELSRIAFIELVSDRNTSVLRKKILLEHGAGDGEFLLPENVNSGMYTVLAYTNWLKNFGEKAFHRQNILIINPEHDASHVRDTSVNQQTSPSAPGTEDDIHTGIQLIPDKHQYATREQVTLKIKLVQSEGEKPGGDFSVSVNLTEPALKTVQYEGPQRKPEIQAEDIVYLPDFRGIRLTGKLEDAYGALQGAEIILSEPGPGTNIKSTSTDSEGTFHFLLEPQEGEKDIVFTLPENNVIIKLEEPFWNGFRNLPVQQELSLDDGLVDYLENKFYNLQLQHKFSQSSFSEIVPVDSVLEDNERFYFHTPRNINIDDYVLLDSLAEYFYELIPSVKLISNRGKYDIKVTDRVTSTYFKETPGVFIDGVFYTDYNQIAHIPVRDMAQISILPEVYYYHDFSFGGIIDLHTKKSDFSAVQLLPKMTRLVFPLASKSAMEFNAVDHSQTDTLKRIPDLRYLICWEPDFTVGSEGENTVQFYTGDITGEFTVKVTGILPDGKIIHDETKIFVGKEFYSEL